MFEKVSVRALLSLSIAMSAGAASADARSANVTAASEQTIEASLDVAGARVSSTWYVPATNAKGWVVLMHGFARNKGHMKDLATRLQKSGLIVFTPSVGVGQINSSAFLDALGSAVRELKSVPTTDLALPARVVIAGHSAGGKNAAALAASLRASAGDMLAGVVLLDPVDRDGTLQKAISELNGTGTEILSILAKPGTCNANGNAGPLLKELDASFKGLRFEAGTHCDAEGASSDALCRIACGQGTPKTVNNTLDFSVNWITGFVNGSKDARFFPGGTRFEEVIGASEAAPLE